MALANLTSNLHRPALGRSTFAATICGEGYASHRFGRVVHGDHSHLASLDPGLLGTGKDLTNQWMSTTAFPVHAAPSAQMARMTRETRVKIVTIVTGVTSFASETG